MILKTVPKAELELLKSLRGLGTEEEEGYRTGPPGYIGWRNSFLAIDSGAPYTFKNSGSEQAFRTIFRISQCFQRKVYFSFLF